jgi:hypothetical protein
MNNAKSSRQLIGLNFANAGVVSRVAYAIAAVGLVVHNDRATAATIVTPNIYATTAAPEETVLPFDGTIIPVTFQWIVPASEFSTVPLGSQISAIGFRLNVYEMPPAADAAFSQWNLKISSRTSPSLTLDATFAANIGSDVVTVRSGPLLIPANAVPFDSPQRFFDPVVPNSFFDIPFTTPYTYTSGSLVLTLSLSGHDGDPRLALDGEEVISGLSDTVEANSLTSPTGRAHFYNFPVTRFTYVPEPSSAILSVLVLTYQLGCSRRRSCRR